MKTLVTILMVSLFGTAAWAVCLQGYVPASCPDRSMNCCMPEGRFDCGNGMNNPIREKCAEVAPPVEGSPVAPPTVPPGASEGLGGGKTMRQPIQRID